MLFDTLTEILDPQPHAAALNMAIDEVLLRGAAGPLLRIYGWERAAVSFGYFGKVADVEQAWPGREWVRRWTGGGVVPHGGGDVTYTIVVPRWHPFARLGARDSYRLIHEQIAALLRGAGCAASVAPAAQAKVSEACFENPAAYDVLTPAGKVAGAAQRRTQWGLLHQGSIQISAEVGDVVAAGLGSVFSPRVSSRGLTGEELTAAEEVARTKYGTEAWERRF